MKKFISVFMAFVVCFSLVIYVPGDKVSAAVDRSALKFDGSFYDSYNPDNSIEAKYKNCCEYLIDLYELQNKNYLVIQNTSNYSSTVKFFVIYSNGNLSYVEDNGSDYTGIRYDLDNNDFYIYEYRISERYLDDPSQLTLYNVSDFDFLCFRKFDSYDEFYLFGSGSFKSIRLYNIITNFNLGGATLPDLSFTVAPDLSENMDLADIGGSVTVTCENPTSKAYDYMIFVSKSPSDIGTVNSMYAATYFNSSNQWCYTKQSDTTIPPDKIDLVKDKINDQFKTTDILDILLGPYTIGYNIWGGMYDAAKEYMSYQEDHVTYYSKTQTSCPVYLVNPGGAKEHTIPFSAFNITMSDTYYFNIVYKEHFSNVVSSVGASAAALLSAAGGEYDAPIFNTADFTSYLSYISIPFSVGSGYTSVNKTDDITGFNVLTYYSNPDNSVANITNDNSVHINDSFNTSTGGDGSGGGSLLPGGAFTSGIVVNGVLVNGTANFSPGLTLQPGGSGSGGSGSSLITPELPEAEFKDLFEQSGDFFKFFKDLIESSGFLPVSLFTSACVVALFMRVWGR